VQGAVRTVPRRPPYSVAARDLLRSSLLDAACHMLQERRWADITMAEVAGAAGVSRQTLYKEFGSRVEFARTLLLREADTFLNTVERALEQHRANPAGALAIAFELYLTAAAGSAPVAAIVGGDGADELLALMTRQGEPLLDRAAERLRAVLRSVWPLLQNDDAQLLSECLVRLAISYTALPKGPPSVSATSMARLLGPYIEGLAARDS
jgi:AcrR family transcriptional regulator